MSQGNNYANSEGGTREENVRVTSKVPKEWNDEYNVVEL